MDGKGSSSSYSPPAAAAPPPFPPSPEILALPSGGESEDLVMSEVHLGCPPDFSGRHISRFTFSLPPVPQPAKAMDSSLTYLEPSSKKRKASEGNTSTAIVQVGPSLPGPTSGVTSSAQADAELLFREQQRVTLELNPLALYIRLLKDRKELGYRRSTGKNRLEMVTYEIDVPTLRTNIGAVMRHALIARYQAHTMMRQSDIVAEIDDIVPLVSDMCMSALYAKLHTLHKSYGRHPTRYTPPPCYSKDVELPLPFALAIQEFGAFETHSLKQNVVYAPTYPEGVINEGRENQIFSLAEYLSYLPTLRELGIPLKSVDPCLKNGSAWWTYKVENVHNTSDLVCTLPPSHYSDLSAIIRSCFLVPDAANCCKDIITFPQPPEDYGTRMREFHPGYCVRSFLALCHGPEEEWSFGTS
ncbi:hypothetical protein U1Q18_006620 [Sarracenia purpurea var. burkii]